MKRAWLISTVVVLIFAAFATLSTPAEAQSDATATAAATKGVEAYQTQVADQQATIEALQTQVAQLEKRLDTLSGTGAKKTPTPKAGEASKTYEVGDSFDVGPWTVTISKVELAPTIDLSYSQSVARGVYVVVYMTLTNNGDAPTAFPYDQLVVMASDGKSYGFDSDSAISFQIEVYKVALYDKLQPGLAYETVATFDVPPAATGLKLTTTKEEFTVDLGV